MGFKLLMNIQQHLPCNTDENLEKKSVNGKILGSKTHTTQNHKIIHHKIKFHKMKIPSCILAFIAATTDCAFAANLRASTESVIKPLHQENHGYVSIEIDHVIGILTDNCNEIVVKAFDSASNKVLGFDVTSSEVDGVYVIPSAKSNNLGTDVSWWTPRGFLWHMTYANVEH